MPPKTAKTLPARIVPQPQPTDTQGARQDGPLQTSSPHETFPSTHHPDELLVTSPSTKSLDQAIATFQSHVRFVAQDASGYKYKYASLPAIIDTIDPYLQSCDLSIKQFPHSLGHRIGVLTIITHLKSGEWMRKAFSFPIPYVAGSNVAQAAGSAITYARRYAIASILGLIVDPDMDGNP